MRQLVRARVVGLLHDVGANLRLGYAVVLGLVGLAALLVAAVIGLQRQWSLESRGLHITQFDRQRSGYFVVDPPIEPIVPTQRQLRVSSSGLLWLASAMLVGAAGIAAWHITLRQQRSHDAQIQRIRRSRTAHVPARTAAKRHAILTWLDNQGQEPRSARLTVRQLMTEAFATALPTASIPTLANLLASGSSRHVLIRDYGGRLLGIVTAGDLRHRRGKRAADVMTPEPVCVPPGALLGPAATLMVDHQISCLPVVDQGQVRGVLTSDDLALALDCVLQGRDASRPRQTPLAEETAVLSDIQTLCVAARSADSGAQRTPAPPDEVQS